MKKLLFHTNQLITFLVAFQILSVGLLGQKAESITKSSVFCEIITLDEFGTGVVLHHDDAVREPKKHSKKDIQTHKRAVYKVNNIVRSLVTSASQTTFITALPSFSNQYDYQYFEDIIPPPPKNLT